VSRRRWLLLAGLTTALSVDEATVLHERLDRAVLPWLSPDDFPYLWVVPGLVLGLAVVVSVAGLTRAAPAPARRRLLLGFGLLLGSALGGEAVQGVLVSEGLLGWPFVVTYHLEELGETLGAIALLVGAVRVLDVAREPAGVRVRLADAAPPSSVRVGRQADDHLPDVASA
jgi:MFS family permease